MTGDPSNIMDSLAMSVKPRASQVEGVPACKIARNE